MSDCLFCKIVEGRIPAKKVYEDEDILAFNDINPARPVHLLVIPKHHLTSLATVSEADIPVLGRMLAIANRLASEQGSPDGFRVIINTGRVGHQEVPHLHAHIVGGPEPVGPMLKRVWPEDRLWKKKATTQFVANHKQPLALLWRSVVERVKYSIAHVVADASKGFNNRCPIFAAIRC